MPSLRATALPHTAIESATMQSGRSERMSAQTMSSSARVVSVSTWTEKATSLPMRAPSAGVRCCSQS